METEEAVTDVPQNQAKLQAARVPESRSTGKDIVNDVENICQARVVRRAHFRRHARDDETGEDQKP